MINNFFFKQVSSYDENAKTTISDSTDYNIKYKVKPHPKGWVIERPDGTHVNETVFKTEEAANKYLEILVALGYAEK